MIRTKIIIIIEMFVVLLLILAIVQAHGASPNKPTHQYITNESGEIWKLMPYEIKNHLNKSIYYNATDITDCYDMGEDIISGSGEEDFCGLIPMPPFLFHYWNPDEPLWGTYSYGLQVLLGSYPRARIYWEEDIIKNYLKGDTDKAYYYLGRLAHLVQDITVPAHAHSDCHIVEGEWYPSWFLGCGDDSYESFIADVNGSFTDTTNKPNFYHWRGSDYIGQEYKYENLTYLTDEQWLDINPRLDEADYPSNLFKLMWYTAQKTQYYASDDIDGNDYYRRWYDIWSAQDFNPSLWQGEDITIINDSSSIEENQETCGINNCSNLKNISNALMPHAMKATAGLYRLFYDVANSYHWPTFHHDNRRTGFTLLKGDMEKDDDIDKINLVLQGGVTADHISRASIADLDKDGKLDIVVAASKNIGIDGYVFAYEKGIGGYKPKWETYVGEDVLAPPSIDDIDNDGDKEIVFGMDNGTLVVLDGNGNYKWTYTVPIKNSPSGSFRGELSFTAIEDLDFDGKKEIIFIDEQLAYADWPGDVYVLEDNGNTYAEEDKVNISNGGGHGAVSIADIDSDGKPEIVVPSFYGIYVFDFVNGKLLNKWNNSNDNVGKISNSAVIYDVDNDNEYELVYTTSTSACEPSKTCYNRIYIRDASDGTLENYIDLGVLSRTTPAIANLDNDANAEIVITSRKSTFSDDGNIIGYDAVTKNVEFNYSDDDNLKTMEISPDIADIDGDGNYEIIFAELGNRLFILDKNGNKNYTINLQGQIGSAPAIGDTDNDGVAEIAVKRAGSPITVLNSLTSFNQMPGLADVSNLTAIAGDLININKSGEVSALDFNGDSLTYYFSSPFNSSGLWQSTINDTGNYTILVEASDGNLSDSKLVNLMVFNYTTKLQNNFSDNANEKSLSFTGTQNKTVYVRLPKNASVIYSRIKITGGAS